MYVWFLFSRYTDPSDSLNQLRRNTIDYDLSKGWPQWSLLRIQNKTHSCILFYTWELTLVLRYLFHHKPVNNLTLPSFKVFNLFKRKCIIGCLGIEPCGKEKSICLFCKLSMKPCSILPVYPYQMYSTWLICLSEWRRDDDGYWDCRFEPSC